VEPVLYGLFCFLSHIHATGGVTGYTRA
jgi:hypothetical protein